MGLGDGSVANSLPEDPGVIFSTYVGRLTTTWNSRNRGPDALFWLTWVEHPCI